MSPRIVLLRPKWIGLKRMVRRTDGFSLSRPLVLAGLTSGFWFLTFWVLKKVLAHFRAVELLGDLLAGRLLAMVLLVFFSVLLFSNIISALSIFFLAEDLPLVLSRPVRLGRLYYARLSESLAHSSWMVLLFGWPLFFTYGWVYQSPWGYYLMLPALLIPFLVIPAVLGVAVAMVLVNILPARRTKDVLLLLSVFFVIALYFLLRFMQPERLVNPDSFAGMVEYLTALNAPSWPLLPSFWMCEALLPFYQERPAPSGFYLALLWSTAGAAAVFGEWTAGRLFRSGWSKAQEAHRALLTRTGPIEWLFRLFNRPLDRKMRALAVKDSKRFFRDTSQWSQLFLLGALIVVYLYNLSVLPLDKAPLPGFFLQNLISFLNMGLAGFVLSAISLRFVFPAVSLEGPAFWIVRSSPISARSFLLSKFWVSLIPLLVLAEILIFLSNLFLKATSFMMVLSALTLFAMTLGLTALGVGLGALFPRLRIENAAQISSGFGGVLYMIMSLGFIALVVLLEAWPVYTIFMADLQGRALTIWEIGGAILSFSGVGVIIALAVVIPLRRGWRRIAQGDLEG